MLAGLIFATEEADDRPDALAATLPFGGMTLLEYQVRLMVGAGAGHVLIAVGRVTPALLGAVSRASRRGVTVDVVRSAGEALQKVHPLARILVMADGLVSSDPVIDRMASGDGEAILVTKPGPAALERLDSAHCWAGIARIPASRLTELARLPDDYDFAAALLRIVVQAAPEYVLLPPGAAKAGHGVERNADALATRSNAVLAALTERRASWADRWVFTRIARVVLPGLVVRGMPAIALPIAGGIAAIAGVGAIWAGWAVIGFPLAIIATAALSTGSALSALRGEDRQVRMSDRAVAVLAASAFAALALFDGFESGTPTAIALAASLIAAMAISERAATNHRRWWASPAGLILLGAPLAMAGFSLWALALALAYQFASLASVVEGLREKA